MWDDYTSISNACLWIIPALESSHAISEAMKVAKKGKSSESIVVTLSGRGDKDVEEVQKYLDADAKNK